MNDIVKYESNLDVEKHNKLANKFNPFAAETTGLIQRAKQINVESVTDTESMSEARTIRLQLKNIRVDVEKTRKQLKEDALREGNAIDGMANIIKYMIVPVEKDLQEKEDYAARMEEERLRKLAMEREHMLKPFDVDCRFIDLENMPEEAFENLLKSSEAGHKSKLAAEKAEAERQVQERIQREKEEAERQEKERIERERIEKENAELKRQAEIAAKKEAQMQAERQRVQAELDRKIKEQKEREAKEQAEKAAAIQAALEAEQSRLSAPDKAKLMQLDQDICGLQIPSVQSDAAIDAVSNVRELLNKLIKDLRAAIKAM